MHVYSYGTVSFYTYLLLMVALTQSWDPIDDHWKNQKIQTDTKTPPNVKITRLFSKSSRLFVQIMKKDVRANGLQSSDKTILKIESDTFGRVRISDFRNKYYICMNAKGEIIALGEKKGKRLQRCIFREIILKDGHTQFVSDKFGDTPRYLAFRLRGEPKHYSKVFGTNQKATKFLSFPVNKNKPKKRKAKRHIEKVETTKYESLANKRKKETKKAT